MPRDDHQEIVEVVIRAPEPPCHRASVLLGSAFHQGEVATDRGQGCQFVVLVAQANGIPQTGRSSPSRGIIAPSVGSGIALVWPASIAAFQIPIRRPRRHHPANLTQDRWVRRTKSLQKVIAPCGFRITTEDVSASRPPPGSRYREFCPPQVGNIALPANGGVPILDDSELALEGWRWRPLPSRTVVSMEVAPKPERMADRRSSSNAIGSRRNYVSGNRPTARHFGRPACCRAWLHWPEIQSGRFDRAAVFRRFNGIGR